MSGTSGCSRSFGESLRSRRLRRRGDVGDEAEVEVKKWVNENEEEDWEVMLGSVVDWDGVQSMTLDGGRSNSASSAREKEKDGDPSKADAFAEVSLVRKASSSNVGRSAGRPNGSSMHSWRVRKLHLRPQETQ